MLIYIQGCESVCEKKSEYPEMPGRCAFQCIQTALKVWKWGFVKSKKSLKLDSVWTLTIHVNNWIWKPQTIINYEDKYPNITCLGYKNHYLFHQTWPPSCCTSCVSTQSSCRLMPNLYIMDFNPLITVWFDITHIRHRQQPEISRAQSSTG